MAVWTTIPSAGSKLRASVLSSLITEVRPIVAVKTADDTRTSTTYTTDSELSVTIPAAGTYDVNVTLIYNGPTGGTNGRLKVRFNFPTGALSIGHIGGINNSTSATANIADTDFGAYYNDTSSPTSDFQLPTVNTTVELTAIFEGTLVATASGTFSIDTAQISASGTTTIRTHSKLVVNRTGI